MALSARFCGFWNRVLGIGFHRDFHWGALFELYLIAVLVLQGVLDTDLSIQVIRVLDGDLSFFRFLREGGRDDFFDRSRLGGFWFLFILQCCCLRIGGPRTCAAV